MNFSRAVPPIPTLIMLAALAAVSACTAPPPAMPPRPPAVVTVAVAQSQDVPIYLDEIGRTVPSAFVNIQPQVNGQIMKRHFTDGQELKINAPLFTIDPRPYQAAVEQADANLEQAKAQLELAQADFTRYQEAFKTKAASQEDLDTKKANFDTATALVKVNQAALDTATLNLSFCTIDSPLNGRAGERLVDEGNIVKTNDTSLVTIQQITPIYADFTIVEADLPRVRDQMAQGVLKTLIALPQSPDVKHSGTLTFLDTNVEQGAGRIHLRATIANDDRYFWPGQFVNVRLVLSIQKNAVLIPYGCTQMGQQGPYVYVVKTDRTADQRPVTLGQRQTGADDRVVILSGVAAGESVIRTGQLTVNPGGTVRILEPAPPPSGTSQAAAGAARP